MLRSLSHSTWMVFHYSIAHKDVFGPFWRQYTVCIFEKAVRIAIKYFCSFVEMPEVSPIVVEIWCGYTSKPTDLNEYLKPFVTELSQLLEEGIIVNDHKITVKYRCCICGSPARAFIKGINKIHLTFNLQCLK